MTDTQSGRTGMFSLRLVPADKLGCYRSY